MFLFRVGALSLVLVFSLPISINFAQEPGQAIVFYSVTAPKGLKPKLFWVAYDVENEKMYSKKGKDKKVETIKGDTISKVKTKEYETRYYYLDISPGTYVLHSILSKASLTSFFPTSPGFSVSAGDVLFLGDFEAEQRLNTYRGLVDPRTGISLVLLGNDPGGFSPKRKDLNGKGLSGSVAQMKALSLYYFPVEDYTRETSDDQ